MPAYFIGRNRTTDVKKLKEYIPKAIATMLPYEPEFLVMDEQSQILEGSTDLPRTFIVKFKSRADAQAWYDSPAYREVLPLRLDATEGIAMIVDGYAPKSE